jgi:primosomal protein N' (replication factor Y) (superfamily II helicase)
MHKANMKSQQIQKILHIALPLPFYRLFDYIAIDNQELKPGIRIKVPFGKRELIGILLNTSSHSAIEPSKLKPVITIIDQQPILSSHILKLCKWSSNYYHYPIGEVIFNALPAYLRKGREFKVPSKHQAQDRSDTKIHQTHNTPIKLNQNQQTAINTINKSHNIFNTFLINGVTGSGKTEVYIQAIKQTLANDQQVLVLVPEIGLTPQLVERFSKRFIEPIATIHSALTDLQRFKAWQLFYNGDAKIMIGTRSAIFAECPKLGLIIIDEEHDISFKQQERFRYSAKDLAIVRAQMLKTPIVLGSATPSLETTHNVTLNKYVELKLPERAGASVHPEYKIIDICKQNLKFGLADSLINSIRKHINNKNQVILFLNRRGYAPVLMCHACGYIATCKNCSANLTLHSQPSHLHCHHCDTKKPVFQKCPECKSLDLQDVGVGTEQLELGLKHLFPHVDILRIDRDTTRKKNTLNNMLEDIKQGEPKILIGTQMLAKGHHFPNVTMVGIINIDHGFF